MKKSFKKLLASLIVVIIVFSASPLNSFVDLGQGLDWVDFNVNANAASYSGTCGNDLKWDLNADTGELIISGTGDMTEFTSAPPWEEYISLVKSVTVEDGVKSVSGSAFDHAENLETVTLADSVTAIGDYAFDSCKKLTYIDLGNGVKEIPEGTFLNCTSLKSIVIPNTVTFIGAVAFQDCSSLEFLVIGANVNTIAYFTFSGCTALKNVYYVGTEGDWNDITIGLENDCLLSATLHFNQSGDFFSGSCGYELYWKLNGISGELEIYGTGEVYTSSLPWTEYGDLVRSVCFGEGITSVPESACEGFKNLESIIFDCYATHILEKAFYDCDKLTSVSFPDSIVCISNEAFAECDNLSDVDLGYNVKTLGTGAFKNCDSITYMYIPISATDGMYDLFYDCDGLVSVELGDGMTEIPMHMFYSCDNLKDISIGSNVTRIDSRAFYNCTSLQSIEIPSAVTDMDGDMFKYCPALQTINVDKNNTVFSNDENGVLFDKNKTTILFYPSGKTNTDYTIPNGVTRLEHSSFYYSKLVNVTIPSTVTEIDHSVFFYCDNLEHIYYDGTKEDWGKISIKTMNNANLFDDTVVFLKESHTCQFGEWTVTVEPTATQEGSKEHSCNECGSVEAVTIPAMGFEPTDSIDIDFATNTISGFNAGETSIENYVTLADDTYTWEYETQNGKLGTGSKVILKDGDNVIGEYTVVVYGDTNGDSWYDGQDAVLVSCLANGMLTKDDVGEAVYTAADCNHDGVIDEHDVALLNEAGAILANVDQSKSAEVLLETSSAYVEYISLIDQTPELETEEETDAPDIDVDDSEPVEGNSIFTFISDFIAILKNLFNFILSFVNI